MSTLLDLDNGRPVPSGGKLVQGGPPLAGRPHILPFIAADRADRSLPRRLSGCSTAQVLQIQTVTIPPGLRQFSLTPV